MVQKYVKKPVPVEAMRVAEVPHSIFAVNMFHDWVEQMKKDGLEDWMGDYPVTVSADGLHFETGFGVQTAKPGDWILKDVEGKFYPCSDEVFQKTYELAPEA